MASGQTPPGQTPPSPPPPFSETDVRRDQDTVPVGLPARDHKEPAIGDPRQPEPMGAAGDANAPANADGKAAVDDDDESSDEVGDDVKVLPHLFVFAPPLDSTDHNQRVGIWVSEPIKSLRSRHVSHYRGDPSQLDDLLQPYVNGLTEDQKVSDPVVFLITCHGDEKGFFMDEMLGMSFWWTPQMLWEGFEIRSGSGLVRYQGLSHYAEQIAATGRCVFVVFAQCHGAFFADKVSQLALRSAYTAFFEVVGLSYDTTQRLPGSGQSVSTITTHIEIAKWWFRTFAAAVDKKRLLKAINGFFEFL